MLVYVWVGLRVGGSKHSSPEYICMYNKNPVFSYHVHRCLERQPAVRPQSRTSGLQSLNPEDKSRKKW